MTNVTKAAAISSAMLARKSSYQKGRESLGLLADMQMLQDERRESAESALLNHAIMQNCFKLTCALSMVSVSLHTPHTMLYWPPLNWIIFVVDAAITLLFTAEACIKIYHRGLLRSDRSYLRDRWCVFDGCMLILHWLSVLMHGYQLACIFAPPAVMRHLLPYKDWYGVVRSPRPLIMIRFIRSLIKFRLPRNRVQQILKRSSQQIQNVTIFFLFFMALYAILGVQFFGRMDYHCVLSGTNPNNVTIADLAIPDTMCSEKGKGGYECPDHMVCMKLNMTPRVEGFYGMFDDFGMSVFTVYMAASQEGWVYVLYDCLDTMPSYWAFFYFVTLIFFLAWLVKNVFIAVITETFAEIRVQFSQFWASREVVAEEEFRQMLETTDDGSWRLVTIDADKPTGRAPEILHKFLRSTSFQISMMLIVLSNAFINASFVHRHDESDARRKRIYYFIECGFTLLFNLECLFKVICNGWKSYIRRGQHKFELILCIGSTLNIIKPLYDTNIFTYFQVFRIARLIKASPMLEDFVYKIFGPGKKLGGLIIFTMVVLIITSAISLQLFCYVPTLDKFRTFPQALMSMFQILTQEGWTDIVVEVMRTTNDNWVPFVAVYFVGYHLFVTLIVLSLFVAVILDNLEMDEELKKIKQLKAREQTTSMRTKLPWRLRIFEKFPNRPQMIRLKRVASEFPLPKVRDSFARQFATETIGDESSNTELCGRTKSLLQRANRIRNKQRQMRRLRQIGQLSSKACVTFVIEESNKTRALLSDSTGFIPLLGRYGAVSRKEQSRLRHHQRGLHGSTKMKPMYDHLKENGDLVRPTDSAPKQDLKQGEIDIKALQQKRQHAEITRNRIEEEMRENHPYFDRPLFAVGRESRFRRLCQLIVYAKYMPIMVDLVTGKQMKRRYKQLHVLIGLMTYLDWTMVVLTSLSCISMLFESPWPTSGENLVFNNGYLQIAEYLFVLAMTFELAVKILANGLFFTPKAVVCDPGGVMTVFIYLTSLIYLCWMPTHVQINSGAQLLMIFRALRPLRIYTLVPHIRRVVVELCKGFREIVLVTVLLIVLMFIFASFGVQIAGGKLAKCNDVNITTKEDCTGVFMQMIFVTRLEVYGKNDDKLHPQILVPRVWSNPRNFNFDHIGNAMLTLFETLSYKGWNVVRDILLARQGSWAAVFIHIYVFSGCMIGLTLFVGVVIANYSENRGTALLTVDQRRWHDLKARLKMAQPLHVPPKPAESAKLRLQLYELTTSSWFKQIFTILVVVNSATLVVPWSVDEETERSAFLNILTGLSAVITLLFAVEIILKAIAFTMRGFWQSRRNRVDLLITVLGLFWIAAHLLVIVLPAMASSTTNNAVTINNITRTTTTTAPTMMTTVQLNRKEEISTLKMATYKLGYFVVIMRFFTIAGRKSTLKMLMLTVVMSMFRSFFIIMAMFLLVLFYAYAGTILFGTVKYGQAVSKHVNFRSGSDALVVLFRIVTGEDWNEIMHDCMKSPPFCYWKPGVAYWQTDCGNYFGAIIYFCSFYLIITYIVLNLLVAIIMENFSLFYSSEEDALLSYADIRNFQQVWNIVDLEQKRSIAVRKVKFLLRLLKGRLEVDPNKDRLLFKHMCYEMERLHNGDDISFHDVISMLSYRSVDIRKSLQLEELLQREELEYIIEEEVAKQTIRSWLERCLRRFRVSQNKNPHMSIMNSLRAANQEVAEAGAAAAAASGAALETTGSDDEHDDRRRKKPAIAAGRSGRRTSIPELVGEAAKKFMLGSGGSGKSKSSAPQPPAAMTPDRPTATTTDATAKSSTNAPIVRDGSKRPTLKGLQMPTYELPDVEEKAEDTNESPLADSMAERRHSALPQLTTDATAASTSTSSQMLANQSMPSVEHMPDLDVDPPDIRGWWSANMEQMPIDDD